MARPMNVVVRNHPLVSDLIAMIAGFVLPFSLAPFNFWVAGVLSILLLLFSLRSASVLRGAFRFYLYNVCMFLFGISWIYVSIHDHGGAGRLLAGSLVLLFSLAISLIGFTQGYIYMRWFNSHWVPAILAFPALWALKEWVFTWFLTGFPWLFIGYGHLNTLLSGYAPIMGVLGVSFVVVLSASLINRIFDAQAWKHRGTLLLLLAGIWLTGFGLKQIIFVKPEGAPISVSAVQGNIAQETKWTRAMVRPIIDKYLGLTETEWGRGIIVWPEASITLLRESASGLLQQLRAEGEKTGSTVVLGIPERDDKGFYNTAVAVGTGGGEYVKRRLVPFGEYVPMESVLRGLIRFFDLPMSRNRAGDWHQPLLRAAGINLGMSICYEIVYPNIVRDTPEVPDALVTISNDTWFGHSIGPKQHMQMAQMRALENGRYLIRATNNGISAIVSPTGNIEARIPEFEAGVLRGDIYRMVGVTLYTRFGDLSILLISITSLLLCLVVRRYFERNPSG